MEEEEEGRSAASVGAGQKERSVSVVIQRIHIGLVLHNITNSIPEF